MNGDGGERESAGPPHGFATAGEATDQDSRRALSHELEQTRVRLRRANRERTELALALQRVEGEAAEHRRREHEFEEARVAYYELDLARHRLELAEREREAIEGSLSWRLTRPLRLVSQRLGLSRRLWR